MSKTNLPAAAAQSFESHKQNNEHGAEYWSARDLQPMLGYSHFAGAGKMVDLGSGTVNWDPS